MSHHNPLDANSSTSAVRYAKLAVLLVMAMSLFVALRYAFRKKTEKYHVSIVTVMCLACTVYLGMVANIGWTPEIHSGRPVWYLRYFYRLIHGHLVLPCILRFTLVETSQVIAVHIFYSVSVFGGFVGALVGGAEKWSFYVFGVFNFFLVAFIMLQHVPLNGFHEGRYCTLYFRGAEYMLFIWMIYPICWALSEGTQAISPSSEFVLNGLLDLASGPAFFWLYTRWSKELDSQAVQGVAATETKEMQKGQM